MSFAGNGPGDVSLGEADRAAAVAAVKAWARVGHDGEDALMAMLAEGALGLAERFIGQVTIAREMVAVLDPAPGWQRLPAMPVRAILAVRGLPADGAAFTLAAEDYALDLDADGTGWVLIRARGLAGRIEVTLTAGMAADWAALPSPIAQGAARLAAHWFNARDAGEPAPLAVTALWRPYRRVRLSEGASCWRG